MRTQYSIILFVLCMNLACLIIQSTNTIPLQGVPPITQSEFEELNQTVNPETSLRYLNQTSLLTQVGVMIGDVVGGLRTFVTIVYWIVDGFAHMLDYWGTPYWISWAVRIVFWFSISIMIVEIILSRSISD